MLNRFRILYHTLKYLKFTQVYHQVWYRIKSKLGIVNNGSVSYDSTNNLTFTKYINNNKSYFGDNNFRFINLENRFDKIDWNYSHYKKLWTYNLNYFDFLHQADISVNEGVDLILNFIDSYQDLNDGKEPYPTSLRIINIVKFILINNLSHDSIDNLIAKDAYRLTHNLEYHLMANHLLENAFALYFAGIYLDNIDLLAKASKLLKEQMLEQVMNDGAHYELSPMYHQLMLYRVLDSIQITKRGETMDVFLRDKASSMLSWLNKVTFSNGDIPLVNDAAFGINPTTKKLNLYAEQMGIIDSDIDLSDSGYRMIRRGDYECFADVGNASPSYQPGHFHADSLSFIIYSKGQPFIVDTGTSTYNICDARTQERSTNAHNTVVVDGENSSEVWSGFRVARRAITTITEDKQYKLSASHDGYMGGHTRSWTFSDNRIQIIDQLANGNNVAYIHFHPEISVNVVKEGKVITNCSTLSISGYDNIEIESYRFAPQFNTYIEAQRLAINFTKELTTVVEI